MQGGLPISGLLLPFSIRTRLPGTVHVAAAKSTGKGKVGFKSQVPTRPRHADKRTAAASSKEKAVATRDCYLSHKY